MLELECGLKNVFSLEAIKSTLISMDLTLKITFSRFSNSEARPQWVQEFIMNFGVI